MSTVQICGAVLVAASVASLLLCVAACVVGAWAEKRTPTDVATVHQLAEQYTREAA